jgi:nitrilase
MQGWSGSMSAESADFNPTVGASDELQRDAVG